MRNERFEGFLWGQVLLFGRDVTGWPSHRRTALGMARTFQITSLFPRLTVLDNVLLAIEGVQPSKFVMWRFMSSYRDVYDKAHGLLERAAFMDPAGACVKAGLPFTLHTDGPCSPPGPRSPRCSTAACST